MAGHTIRICLTCGKDFLAYNSAIEAGGGRYCSRPCFRLGCRKPRLTATCFYCGGPITSKTAKKDTKYCSNYCKGRSRVVPLADRFWMNVRKTKGCWYWVGAKREHGYGLLGHDGQLLRAHRVSYELAYGPFDPELHVLHKCDNPPCVRPDHLFLGTQADNVADMVAKGRQRKGPKKPAP